MTTINGTSGTDTLLGTSSADRINSGGGDDRVIAGRGNDTILAGTGNDTVFGGADADRIFGERGDDALYGESGNDYIEGGNGDDIIFGGAGRDILKGGEGNDTLYGGNGGLDIMEGGNGADLFIINAGDADPTAGTLFYGNVAVDQWIRIYDLDFNEDDKVGLHDGDGSDGFMTGFVELVASGISSPTIDSFAEWQMLGQYLLSIGADRVVENAQQGSLSFLLTDEEGQTTAVEFYGYSMSELI